MVLGKWNCVRQLTFILSVKYCLYCTLTVTNMAMVRKSCCSLLYLTQSERVPVDVTHKNGLLLNVIKLCVNLPVTPITAHNVCHTSLVPWRPDFNSRPLDVGSVVRKATLGDDVRVFSYLYHSTNIPFTYFLNCYEHYIISAMDNVVNKMLLCRALARSHAF